MMNIENKLIIVFAMNFESNLISYFFKQFNFNRPLVMNFEVKKILDSNRTTRTG
jgi:hypothetical protein